MNLYRTQSLLLPVLPLLLSGIIVRCPLRWSQSNYVIQTNEAATGTIATLSTSGGQNVVYSLSADSAVGEFFQVTNNGELKALPGLKADTNTQYTLTVKASSDECEVRARVTVAVLRNLQPPVIRTGNLPVHTILSESHTIVYNA